MKGELSKMRTVIYARRSTMKKSQSDTIENQINICRRRAKEMNLTIVDVKTDTGTGRTDNSRDEIKELIKDAKDGKFECVIMKGISRFYRDVEHGIGLIKKLDRSNIRVITIEENFDSLKNRTGTGQLDTSMIAMYLIFAENESKKTAERIKHTQIEKAYAGEWNQVSSIPYGYAYDPETKKLKVDVMSSEIIKLIFRLYLDGMGMKSIAFYLNGDNPEKIVYPSPRGKKWNQYTISFMLKNRVYVGDVVFNKRSRNARPYKNPEAIGKSDDDVYIGNDFNAKDLWIITENAHEAIISREEFENVQKIMEIKGQRKGIKNNISLLASVSKCGKCGSGMTYKRSSKDKNGRSNGNDKYYCSHYIKYGKKYCDSHHVIAKEFEELIINSLKNALKQKLDYYEVTSNVKDAPNEKDIIKDKIKKIESDIETVSYKTDILLDKNIEGSISDIQFRKMNDKYLKEIDALSHQLEKLKLEEIKLATDKGKDDFIQTMYDEVVAIEDYPKEKQRYIILETIEKITVVNGEIEIEYKF